VKPRILSIDDLPEWLGHYKTLIPEEMAIQDGVTSSTEAVNCLREKHYDVVLLDLCMNEDDWLNRDNKAIQEYLGTKPEGTEYIVVTQRAGAREIRNSVYFLNAFAVLFKDEVVELLKDTVGRALEKVGSVRSTLVLEAKKKLIRPQLESEVLQTLKPKDGIGGMYPMLDTLFGRVVPVAQHVNRPSFEIVSDCVVGVVWSRYLGVAVSFVLSSRGVDDEIAVQTLATWLGYAERGPSVFNKESHRVRMQLFEEPNISPERFELPIVAGGMVG
jgi:CheY-like chemotaxis protein